jgi:hypothetical protein
MYTCPVCGYDALKHPPVDHVICPSCGTQFGLHDEGPRSKVVIQRELREQWIIQGAHWHSRVVSPPNLWNPWTQLEVAGFKNFPWMENLKVTKTVQDVSMGTMLNQVIPQFHSVQTA